MRPPLAEATSFDTHVGPCPAKLVRRGAKFLAASLDILLSMYVTLDLSRLVCVHVGSPLRPSRLLGGLVSTRPEFVYPDCFRLSCFRSGWARKEIRNGQK